MRRALGEYRLQGLRTNLDFCRWVMEHDLFRAGRYDTGFIGAHFRPETLAAELPAGFLLAAETAALLERLTADETGGRTRRRRRSGEECGECGQRESAWRLQHRRTT
jgi:propionyl-CoA carboxylase alpha chain